MDQLTSGLSVESINLLQKWTHLNLTGRPGRLVIQSLEKRTQVMFASQIPSNSASKARVIRITTQTTSRKLAQESSSMIKARNSRLALAALIKIITKGGVKPAPRERCHLSIWLKSRVGLSIHSLKTKLWWFKSMLHTRILSGKTMSWCLHSRRSHSQRSLKSSRKCNRAHREENLNLWQVVWRDNYQISRRLPRVIRSIKVQRMSINNPVLWNLSSKLVSRAPKLRIMT